MINYIQGDLLSQDLSNSLVLQVCNNQGAYGAGISGVISKKYPEVEADYRSLDSWDLGTCRFIEVNSNHGSFHFSNMIAQTLENKPRRLNYKYLGHCFELCTYFMKQFNITEVNMPLIGAGLAGGDWKVISELVLDYFGDYKVSVYYLPKDKGIVC